MPTDPLRMRQIGPDGPFVLPATACSQRRADFLRRGNLILGFYVTATMYMDQGQRTIEATARQAPFDDDTPMKINLEPGGLETRLNYGLLKKLFARSGAQLTNQVFLMVYGNFEAFFFDMVVDALDGQAGQEVEQEAVTMLMGTGWHGKFDRVVQRFGLKLGKTLLVDRFRQLDMGFLGEQCKDPRDFLDRMADFRHRLVHSSGRVDAALARQYPRVAFNVGDLLELPFGLPQPIHLFFVLLSEVIDQAFSTRFGWKRSVVAPESLTE